MIGCWKPNYQITPQIASWLMQIEATRADVQHTLFPVAIKTELRERAQISATHYSTFIEGNSLTLEETKQTIKNKKKGSSRVSRRRRIGKMTGW